MSDQNFEKAVGRKLRDRPGTFVFHPPDDPQTRQYKPGDFMFGCGPLWGVVECKEVQAASFPLSRWTAHQRQHAHEVTEALGRYWLVVHFVTMTWEHVTAYLIGTHVPWNPSKGSLDPAPLGGIALTTKGRTFTTDPIFEVPS